MKTICEKHDSALKSVKNIHQIINGAARGYRYTDNNEVKELLSILNDIGSEVDYIESDVFDAKEMGQKMEDRLKEYRGAIENLGFTRQD